ncbi:hypothetical protein IFM89_021297 [Coptis chinensis]|uniref:Uncharacterized protein n=1 Tax=Coptis chinensis TaxID=261450 RepID=A0A835HUI0_9MAGN|nr:hypothetical protein IFM89_021297 [Coptis chinensis]
MGCRSLGALGVSRYFKSEINDFLDYVHGYWTPNGISWSRDTVELDIDDTSMGFRMLRLHGYEVGANAFKHFEKEGQFFCFIGQMNQGVTEMLSLYRASQVLFPGENILEEAMKFASKFLRETRSRTSCRQMDSLKGLKGRETRYYIDQYGGDDDVWIGKVLYRMYNVSNNLYLDLAKLDYDHCQKMHQLEWIDMERWYKEFNLKDFGLSEDSLLKAYFLAMSNIYEPDRAIERLAWAQTTALIEAVSFYFEAITIKQKRAFIQAFNNSIEHIINGRLGFKETRNELAEAILTTLSDISSKVLEVYEKEVHHSLKHAWNTWLHNWPSQEDKHLIPNNEAELLVNTINLCAGHSLSLDLVSQPEYMHLTNLTNNICNRLRQQTQNSNIKEEQAIINKPTESVELEMQKLVQHVIKRNNNEIAQDIKQTFLTVAKSYNYIAHCDPTTIDLHISKVLFDTVL